MLLDRDWSSTSGRLTQDAQMIKLCWNCNDYIYNIFYTENIIIMPETEFAFQSSYSRLDLSKNVAEQHTSYLSQP